MYFKQYGAQRTGTNYLKRFRNLSVSTIAKRRSTPMSRRNLIGNAILTKIPRTTSLLMNGFSYRMCS